ncbi:ABC transporter ATP-binding protein [Rhizobium lentis]|uniref:ABC transporter ATP-binding protein n=1 Tax=Rhizobium lentis TaxID=1138194 RepID=A0ABS7ICP6_9HYPH|nr:ABC transporter ATP-binding protein [Rhizobium lentis]MBX5088368.1 ABC transporter ATP-binding protein [Rhizobium lentis]
MIPPLLKVEELSVAYQTVQGPFLALDAVDLTINRSEVVGLVGATGCGKSTLANAILGNLPANQPGIVRGSVKLNGVDVVYNRKSLGHMRERMVTIVPQDTYGSLNPLFRVGTQIMDLMRCTSRPKPWWRPTRRQSFEAEIRATLDAVQLPAHEEILLQYPHQLSGGQRQRIMIAMALLPRPQLVVADEPTSALDTTTQIEILRLFRWIAQSQDMSILFATHNLAAAWEVCDKVIVMHGGRVIEAAGRDTFFVHPRHPYTRSLVSSASQPLRQSAVDANDILEETSWGAGCRFSRQCSDALGVCHKNRPPLTSAGPGHLVACQNPRISPTSFDYD